MRSGAEPRASFAGGDSDAVRSRRLPAYRKLPKTKEQHLLRCATGPICARRFNRAVGTERVSAISYDDAPNAWTFGVYC